MRCEQEHVSVTCSKCGAKNSWMICNQCGFHIDRDKVFAVGEAPLIDFRNFSYADWLKSKNITIWIKDKR